MEENEIVVFGDLNSEIRTEQKQANLNEKYGYYISLNSVQMTNTQIRRQREIVKPQGQTSEEIIFIDSIQLNSCISASCFSYSESCEK